MKDICKKCSIKIKTDLNNIYFIYSGNKLDLNLAFSQIANIFYEKRNIVSIIVDEINSKNINDNQSIITPSIISSKSSKNTIPEKEAFKLKLLGYKNKQENKNILINDFKKNQDNKYNILINDLCAELNNNVSFAEEIKIIYNIHNEKKIKIFGKTFVDNNKDKCKILYKNQEYDLTEEFNAYNTNKDKLEIKLIGINNISTMSRMFYDCKYLESVPDMHKWNTSNIKDISYLFSHCSLKSLPDISNWNTSNIISLEGTFASASMLISLPDISKWNTDKVTNMMDLFYRCTSLISLPDLSKWNTSNVTNMTCMFYYCCSLKFLPDISKWDISKVTQLDHFFEGCTSLKYLPDISNWNTSNVYTIQGLFRECSLLEKLPDISKWNTSNIIDTSVLFYNCLSLKSLPDISKWDIHKLIIKDRMFTICIMPFKIAKKFN